jgi:excisionase family DNA binding protein
MTPGETQMTEPLRATEAARRLGITTKDLLRLINDRKIRFVLVDGIAHVPADAIDEYLSRAAS